MRHRPLLANLQAIGLACAFSALTWGAPGAAQAATLSDNTAQSSSDTVAATATNWLAASFTSDVDDSLATLNAVLAATTDSGTSTLALYSSDASGLVPDTALATFTSTSTSAGSLSFTLSGVNLLAGSSYWLVLSNATGTTNWSWTEASEGTGTGFTGAWANSDDAGGVWFSNSALYPLQAAVTISAVPEPATLLMWMSALPLLSLARAKSKGGQA